MSLKSKETSYCEFLITTRSPWAVTVSWHLGELSGRANVQIHMFYKCLCVAVMSYADTHRQSFIGSAISSASEAKQMCYKHSCNKLLYLMMTTLIPNDS